MHGKLSIALLVLASLGSDAVFAQKNFVRTEELVAVEHKGTPDQFKEISNGLLQSDQSEPMLGGRLLLRKYPMHLWDKVAIPSEPIISLAPSECYLCDFAYDFVDLRVRQDWVTLSIPDRPLDFKSHYSLAELSHLDTFGCDNESNFRHISKTTDRSILWEGGIFARMGLVNELRRTWPGLVDLRLVGWVGHAQLALPTAYEDWQRVMKRWIPYAIERVDTGSFDLTYIQKQKSKSHVWFILASLHGRPVVSKVQSYRVVKEFDSKVVALPAPVFQSELFYQDGRLSTAVTGDKSGILWRWDFSYVDEFEVKDSLFSDDHLSLRGVKTIVSPALKAAVEIAAEMHHTK